MRDGSRLRAAHLAGTGCDDADTDRGSRELQRNGKCGDTSDGSGRARIESWDELRELVAQRNRSRCVRTREQGAHVLPCAEEQRLDGRLRHTECAAELVVRKPADLAQHERVPLPSRQGAEGGPHGLEVGGADRRDERIREIGRQLG